MKAELHALAAEKLKNYDVLGLQPSNVVQQWMNRATVLAVPSVTASNGDCEGLPTVIQEGMAMGVPIVATRHAGNCEAITEGESGLTTEERDVDLLAARAAALHGSRPVVEDQRQRPPRRGGESRHPNADRKTRSTVRTDPGPPRGRRPVGGR